MPKAPKANRKCLTSKVARRRLQPCRCSRNRKGTMSRLASSLYPPQLRRLGRFPLAAAVALCCACPALAGTTSGTSMPWETPLQTIQDSLSGPVAKAVGIISTLR